MTNSSEEKINILRLIRTENIGPRTFFSLIKLYGSATAAISHLGELAGKKNIASPQSVLAEIEATEKLGAKIITYLDDAYPQLLLQVPDLPPALSVLGDESLLNKNNIAIVGARNCSLNGKNFAHNLAKQLGEAEFVVVSGLARGIDKACHLGALASGTIAVIAGGINNIYPPEHADLYQQIVKEQGLIVAESAYNASPRGEHFPRRNRIIAGISHSIAVIEATFGSGSLITARMALEYNRELFAMPGFPLDPRASGTNNLLKNGAHILLSAQDIIDNYHQTNLFTNKQRLQAKEAAAELLTPLENYQAPNEKMRHDVEKLLSCHPIGLEELINHANCHISVVLSILLELELAGKVVRHADNKVSLVV
jgi:DNA processing protein